MQSNRVIRKMEEKDLDVVTEIEKSIFSIPWSRNSFKDACETTYNIYLVSENDGNIEGYCGLWTVLGEGNITNMAVASEYRKSGCAEALMQEMEKIGREKNIDIFFLEVRESNTAARNLYKKMGYNDIGIRKRFYEKPVEDAIIMSKIYR